VCDGLSLEVIDRVLGCRTERMKRRRMAPRSLLVLVFEELSRWAESGYHLPLGPVGGSADGSRLLASAPPKVVIIAREHGTNSS
jgi:hypothetical protein